MYIVGTKFYAHSYEYLHRDGNKVTKTERNGRCAYLTCKCLLFICSRIYFQVSLMLVWMLLIKLGDRIILLC